ncbi:MAG TPA: hypothetical protein PKE51_01805 [Gemmatimonadaceae bacterium]|jgi:nucleoid-associated protein YgaU|nr:hypothetical protein [Gemmatimonadaceae bacterium]
MIRQHAQRRSLRRGALALGVVLAALLAPAQPIAAQAAAKAPAAQAPAAKSAPVTAAVRVGDQGPDSAATVSRGSESPTTVQLQREVFSYSGAGRRDPYESLMSSGELRPLVSDLRLTAVAFDPVGRGSVAILRDIVSQGQYRVRIGQTLGRLRVTAIRDKAVIFTIDEFGFSRQETLPLTSDSTTTRTR